MATILHLGDESSLGVVLVDVLSRAGHVVRATTSIPRALQQLAREPVDVVISGHLPPGLAFPDFVELLRQHGRDVPILVVTGHDDASEAPAAIAAGAFDCVTSPVRAWRLVQSVERALMFLRLRRELESLRQELTELQAAHRIVGDSPATRRIVQTIPTAARLDVPVLLVGERGTGKELVARMIHEQSDRRGGPFVQVDCAALPGGLLESALFGRERGVRAGTIGKSTGAVERAGGGTLLLEGIAVLPIAAQRKLLRVLEDRSFERVGGSGSVRADVRVIATTDRDLAVDAEAGGFCRELYQRLAEIPIMITPLRERLEDVPALALHFALLAGRASGRRVVGLAPETVRVLQQHSWPGNVRELRSAIDRAVAGSAESMVQPSALEPLRRRTARTPRADRNAGSGTRPPARTTPNDLPAAFDGPSLKVAEVERLLIERALALTNNNRTRSAELLGISVRTLRKRLSERAIDPTTVSAEQPDALVYRPEKSGS